MIALKNIDPFFSRKATELLRLMRASSTLLVALVLVFTSTFTISVPVALAQNDDPFAVAVETRYSVDNDAITTVTHEFRITNKLPTQYLRQYRIQSGGKQIENVVAQQGDVALEPIIDQTENSTVISVSFPDQVVGQGKTRTFTISYQERGLATAGGSVLEVRLPKLTDAAAFTSRSVIVETPSSFGGPVRLSRQPNTTRQEGGTFIAQFDNIGGDELWLFYGESQLFSLTARYHLDNPTNQRGRTQIALPPDTPFQKMYYHDLNPLPKELKLDIDGNWIATYELNPQTALTVFATATTRITHEPDLRIPFTKPLPQHTSADQYWEVQAQPIVDKVEQLRSNTPLSTVEALYRSVVDELDYSLTLANQPEIPRLGAAQALEKPTQAVCQEFTDVFVTYARAAGVPARRLTGYAYTQDVLTRPVSLGGDVLHAWPEFFDETKGYWRAVDPTWEKTTGGVDYFNQFDLNHVVFAINGASSTTPYPAGSYKTQDTKDIEIEFAQSFPDSNPNVELQLQPRTILGFIVPGLATLSVRNLDGAAWYNLNLTGSAQNSDGQPLSLNTLPPKIEAILPYQTITIPIQINTIGWGTITTATVAVAVTANEQQTEHTLNTSAGPAYLAYIFHPHFVPYLGTGLVICSVIAGSLLVFRRRR